MSIQQVNCRKDFVFQVDLTTPGSDGKLAAPAAGTVTGMKVRLATTAGGSAMDAAVDALAASERSGKAGRFYYQADAADLATYVLATVGHGGKFYAVWSKSGDMDKVSVPFIAVDGETI